MSTLRRKRCPTCGEMMEAYETFWSCDSCGEFVKKRYYEKIEEQNQRWLERMFGDDDDDDY